MAIYAILSYLGFIKVKISFSRYFACAYDDENRCFLDICLQDKANTQ